MMVECVLDKTQSIEGVDAADEISVGQRIEGGSYRFT